MGPKNLETKFLPKKAFCSILSLYTTVTSCKKLKNVTPWLLMVPEKIHSEPFLLEKFQNKVTLKKSFGLISGLFIAITSCKKSEKFHVLIFRPKTLFLPEKSFRSTLRLHATNQNFRRWFFIKREKLFSGLLLGAFDPKPPK